MERLENLAARLIAMAVSLVGDAGPVRKAMACSEYDFEAYCAGGKVPNQQEFERLVELIVREQGNLICESCVAGRNSGQTEARPRRLGPHLQARLLQRIEGAAGHSHSTLPGHAPAPAAVEYRDRGRHLPRFPQRAALHHGSPHRGSGANRGITA